jgi:hypothetical protein
VHPDHEALAALTRLGDQIKVSDIEQVERR